MARDYRKLIRGPGVWVPRWMVLLVVAVAVFWAGLRFLVPPAWTVQRLDSPDGRRAAKLMRTKYVKESLVVLVRDGRLWHTAFYSAPLTNDYRVDLGERLSWSADSERLYLQMAGGPVWGYDFGAGRGIPPAELTDHR